MKSRSFALLALLALLVPSAALALCPGWRTGPLPNSNIANGADGPIGEATVWDPDGAGPLSTRLVVAGSFFDMQGLPTGGLAEHDPATGFWHSLGTSVSGQVMCFTVYNGELIVAGTLVSAGGQPVNRIARWNGSSWQPLGSGILGTYVRAVTVYNGELIAAGLFNTAGGLPVANIARWNGSSWAALGSGVQGNISSIGLWGAELIVGGALTSAGGTAVNGVARWNGSSWSAMGAGLLTGVSDFQGFNGAFWAAGGNHISSWNGTSWSSSPALGNVTFNDLEVYQGQLYVCGEGLTGGGGPANGVFMYDGALHQVGAAVTGTNTRLQTYGNELIAMGTFTSIDARPMNRIARWDGTNWGAYNGSTTVVVQAMTRFGSRTVAAGTFHRAPFIGPVAHNIVGWDGATFSTFGTGMDGPVTALKAFTNPGPFGASELVAGGTFTHAGGVAATSVAHWVARQIAFPPPAWEAMGTGFNGEVEAIERFNTSTYAGGAFTASGATMLNHIARWNSTASAWEPLALGITGGDVYAIRSFGGFLYAGGSFTSAGGVPTGGLARWDGASWSAVGGGLSGQVFALEIHDGQLVIGGLFPGLAGSPNIVQWDGSTYSTLGTGGADGYIRGMHSTGTRLYVGGTFANLGGVVANHMGYWDGSWHEVHGGADNLVNTITHHDNIVDVGGYFTNMDNGSFINTPTWASFDETGVPQFRSYPFSQSVDFGTDLSLTAIPDTGYTNLTLQWYRDAAPLTDGPTGTGSVLSGTQSEVLNIHNLGAPDLGTYTMVVSNSCGSTTTPPATLTTTAGVGDAGIVALTLFEALGPNPTRGAAQAAFSLAREARVRLAVCDVAGRRVRTVDAGRLAAGRHQLSWDARAEDGQRVRAGVYFVGLEVDGRAIGTRSVALVR